MKHLALSIILPCYNVEKYISQCLDSLLDQDISKNDYEIICVNDCSPDGTRDIILKYQQNNSNIVLIDHQVNKKQGGARNTGLKIAQGKYVWFVDPDDYINTQVLKKILNEVFLNNLDVLNISYYKLFPDNSCNEVILSEPTKIITGKNLYIYSTMTGGKNGSICTKIIKKHLIENLKLNFNEGGLFEDQVYSLKIVYFAKRFKYLHLSYYYYRYNSESSMNTAINGDKIISWITFSEDLYKFSQDIYNNDVNFLNKLFSIVIWNLRSIMKNYTYLNRTDRISVIPHLKLISDELAKELGIYQNIINHSHFWQFMFLFITPILKVLRYIKNNFPIAI
jgi:glycosyltransferase involved in cell wall biosynthesis